MGLRTIQQKINAGHDFDGTLPTGSTTSANDMESYTAQNAGGLFDFGNIQPITIKQVQMLLGGQSAWRIDLVDVDASIIATDLFGTTDVDFYETNYDLILLKGQKLKLTTTGASTAMFCRITANTRASSR